MTTIPPMFLCQKKTSLWQRGLKVYPYISKIKCISTFYLRISILQHATASATAMLPPRCRHGAAASCRQHRASATAAVALPPSCHHHHHPTATAATATMLPPPWPCCRHCHAAATTAATLLPLPLPPPPPPLPPPRFHSRIANNFMIANLLVVSLCCNNPDRLHIQTLLPLLTTTTSTATAAGTTIAVAILAGRLVVMLFSLFRLHSGSVDK